MRLIDQRTTLGPCFLFRSVLRFAGARYRALHWQVDDLILACRQSALTRLQIRPMVFPGSGFFYIAFDTHQRTLVAKAADEMNANWQSVRAVRQGQ
ncbi:hypothetical protein [Mesorhizobium hawassense]|uniref:hypothetical protein n=1 Tax=Mesorhizobium hawassense TaxID=1209954 RepID=UPI00142E06D7|nr:hypothetical protein [Mesorhizobium hawassense]